MGWTQSPTVIEEDNQACIDSSVVSHMTKRMRHLELFKGEICRWDMRTKESRFQEL